VVIDALRNVHNRKPRVLDFGCGCGRVARHLVGGELTLHGVDWNRQVVDWCTKHLGPGRFAAGGLHPPLPFDASLRFDLIYAFSVFTHLTADLQRGWLEELESRLDPNGLVVLSTHGRAYAEALTADERTRFDSGRLVVRESVAAGTNVCAAYHPPGSLEQLLPPGLEVLRHTAEGALGNAPQDLWILRKPG
jgi:SAM-dependent methyltransferase